MRFMVMMKANKTTEAGIMPSAELLQAMGAFNEEMAKAGVLLAGEGLKPSSKGARIRFEGGGKTTVVDGPFTESKELIAGFWILQVKSKEEAIAWASRCPGGDAKVDHFGGVFALEVRQVYEFTDFSAEIQQAAGDEPALRAEMERRAKRN